MSTTVKAQSFSEAILPEYISSVASQVPSINGVFQFIDVGSDTGSGSDPVQLASGIFTFNQTATYAVNFAGRVGRTDSTDTEFLTMQPIINGTPDTFSTMAALADSDATATLIYNQTRFFSGGDTLRFRMVGTNASGALDIGFLQTMVSPTSLVIPSVFCRIEMLFR